MADKNSNIITVEQQAQIDAENAETARKQAERAALVTTVNEAQVALDTLVTAREGLPEAMVAVVGPIVDRDIEAAKATLSDAQVALSRHDAAAFTAWQEFGEAMQVHAFEYFTGKGIAPLAFTLHGGSDGKVEAEPMTVAIESAKVPKAIYDLHIVNADGSDRCVWPNNYQEKSFRATPAGERLWAAAVARKGSESISTFEVLTGSANSKTRMAVKDTICQAFGWPCVQAVGGGAVAPQTFVERRLRVV